MTVIDKLLQQLPNELQNIIFFYLAEHPLAIVFKNYKHQIINEYSPDRSRDKLYDYDHYMKQYKHFPIPYSYYRDITYNLFNSAQIQKRLQDKNHKRKRLLQLRMH